MDAVYIVRNGDRNEELRYSVRSVAAHVGVDRVWIAGHRPKWLTGAGHITTPESGHKARNIVDAMRAVCEHPEVADQFVWLDDDMIVLKPLDQIPVCHRGPLAEHVERQRDGWWRETLALTLDWCRTRGYADALSYELHRPFLVDKAAMRAAVAAVDGWGDERLAPQLRTVYGALNAIGGEQAADVKIRYRSGLDRTKRLGFVSTSDRSFKVIAREMRRMFPKPSPYEKGRSR